MSLQSWCAPLSLPGAVREFSLLLSLIFQFLPKTKLKCLVKMCMILCQTVEMAQKNSSGLFKTTLVRRHGRI